MASENGKSPCSICGKEKRAVRCEGCLQLFCYDHLIHHRKELNKELDYIELARDLFREALNEQRNCPKKHSLIKQIDQWEEESIKIIQHSAKKCRQLVIQHTTKNIVQIDINLSKLSDQIRKIRQENDFNEIDIEQINQKLSQLQLQLEQPPDVLIRQGSTPLINKISFIPSAAGESVKHARAACDDAAKSKDQYSEKSKGEKAKYELELIIPPQNIHCNTKWIQYALTFAGGCGEGYQLDQLHSPYGICIDDDDQIMYIADYGNDRIVKWKYGANYGQIAAGGNGKGCRRDQLNLPTDVVFDRKNDSLVICDAGNRRIVRWSRQTNKNQPAIISHIACSRLTIDVNGDVYVSDCEKHEVRRWREGEINDGTIVAGGNGKGDQMSQLNAPTYIFVDQDYSIYVSDTLNHRVMKWTKGAKEGIVVAGGQGEGNGLTQLCNPQGVIVDYLGNIYVADSWNHRVMRWSKGSRKGSIIVGGNGQGQQPDQISCPLGISFDREGSLYVVDWGNHRVQKFDVDLDID